MSIWELRKELEYAHRMAKDAFERGDWEAYADWSHDEGLAKGQLIAKGEDILAWQRGYAHIN